MGARRCPPRIRRSGRRAALELSSGSVIDKARGGIGQGGATGRSRRLENARLDQQECVKRGELVDCRYCSCPDCTTPRCNALPDSPHPRHRTLADHMATHMFWETPRETVQLMHAAPPSSALSYPSTDARCLIGSSDRVHWPNSLDTGM